MRNSFFCFLLFPIFSFGQRIIARTAEQQNVYLNIKNPILFQNCNLSKSDSFKTSNGTVEIINDTLFVTPTDKYSPTVITIFRKDWWNEIAKFSFNTITGDKPKLLLKPLRGYAHESSGDGISWDREKRLELLPPNNLSHLKVDTCSGILSFKVSLVAYDGSFDETYISYSDTIPSAIAQKIKSLPNKNQGDIFWIKVHEIKVIARWVSNYSFYIDDYKEEWHY